jgi:hypothetical protein
MPSKRTVMQLLIALLMCGPVAASSQAPQVLDFYPNCEYKVVDTIKVKSRLQPNSNRLSFAADEVTQAHQELLDKLRHEAQEAGTDSIIITERKLIKPDTESSGLFTVKEFYIQLVADLIQTCQADLTQPLRPVPYNSRLLGESGIWERSYKISRSFSTPEKVEEVIPPVSSREVSFKNGIFSLPLGSSYADLIMAFGEPAVEISLNQEDTLFGYGRHHWLVFRGEELFQATSENQWLSYDLLNLIAEDHRFDSKKWQLNNNLGQYFTISQLQALYPTAEIRSEDHSILLTDPKQTLRLSFVEVMGEQPQDQLQLSGFNLYYSDKVITADDVVHNDKSIYQSLSKLLQNRSTTKPIDLASWDIQPMGSITVDTRTKIFIYNNHLFIEMRGNTVSEINFRENLFSSSYVKSSTLWIFQGVTQGQKMDQVKSMLVGDLIEYEDNLQLSSANYFQSYDFYMGDSEYELISLKMSIY